MVDLPKVSEGIVTSTAPESAVSGREIASQYDAMAGAMNKVADASMDVATKMAKEGAAEDLQKQKVTRDADGNVSVQNPASAPLIFGRAGEAYQQAVTAGTIAQHSNIISMEMNDLHQQYATDPGAFAKAADSWKAKYLQDHGGGEVGLGISQQADQLQAQHFNSITNTAGKLDLAKQESMITANQTSARNDAMTLLRNGDDIHSKAVQSAFDRFDASIAAKAANPLFAYSKEQADLDRNSFHSEAAGSRFLYNTDHLYKDQSTHEETQPDGTKIQVANGGKNAALRYAEDILTNPKYSGLTPEQRDHFFHQAVGEIRANEAIRHQDVSEAREQARDLKLQWSADPNSVSWDDVEQVVKAFDAAGDPGGGAGLRSSFLRKSLADDHTDQPLATQNANLAGLQGMSAVRGDVQYLIGKGYSPHAAAAIMSHAVHESAGDPTSLINDLGQPAGGLFQFRAERLTALQQFAADRQKPWTDRQTQLDFVDHELHTTESATLAKLQAAKTPEEAAIAFYGYERPAGYNAATGDATGTRDYASRLKLAGQIFRGDPGVSLGPAGTSWRIAHQQIALGDAATKQWKVVMDDYNKEQTVPASQTVKDIRNAAFASHNGALLDQIASDSARMNVAGEAATVPIPQQHAAEASLAAGGQIGALPPAMAAIQRDFQARTDAITKGLKENPVATASKYLSKYGIQPHPPIDWSSDQNAAAELQSRARDMKIAERQWQPGGALSVLDTPDLAQVRAMIASPNPGDKLRAFSLLSTLPEDVRGATLAKIGENRPELMVSIAAGHLMREVPDIGASIIRGQTPAIEKQFGPTAGVEEKAFKAQLDKQLPVSTFGLAARTDPSGAYSVHLGMIKARYVDLTAQAGDTSGNFDKAAQLRLDRAANDVTGGVLDHNGGKLIAPARSIGQPNFERVMNGLTDNDLPGVTSPAGQPITAAYLNGTATLESSRDGRYFIRLNKDNDKPVYAITGANTEAPQKFELDLRGRPLGPLTQPATTLDFMAAPATPFVRPPGAPTITGTAKAIGRAVKKGAESLGGKLENSKTEPLTMEEIGQVGSRG